MILQDGVDSANPIVKRLEMYRRIEHASDEDLSPMSRMAKV